MKWNETVASSARYGDVAGRIFGDGDVIWEQSEADYQGSCNVLVAMPDGSFAHYEWSYGSCSGCDEWEASNLSDDEIEATMRNHMATFPDAAAVQRYFQLDGEYADAKVPTANSAQNGSIPGMMRYLGGGISREFNEAGQAFAAWLATR